MDFSKKNVIVTGASGGIGRAIAHQFAERGARVVIHYNHNRVAAEAISKSLPGGPHPAMSANLTEPEEVQIFMADAVASLGRIDILVNNAGIFEEHPIKKIDYRNWLKAWDLTIKTNLHGPANMMYCAVQHMKEHGGGRIVNVSSRGAFRGEPEAPAYGASKAGLNALGQSLAKALGGDGIFVFTVAPGFVETEMARDHLTGPSGEYIRNESPLGRVAKPEEIARTVLFLASEGSEFLTGCIVDINGASYLRT